MFNLLEIVSQQLGKQSVGPSQHVETDGLGFNEIFEIVLAKLSSELGSKSEGEPNSGARNQNEVSYDDGGKLIETKTPKREVLSNARVDERRGEDAKEGKQADESALMIPAEEFKDIEKPKEVVLLSELIFKMMDLETREQIHKPKSESGTGKGNPEKMQRDEGNCEEAKEYEEIPGEKLDIQSSRSLSLGKLENSYSSLHKHTVEETLYHSLNSGQDLTEPRVEVKPEGTFTPKTSNPSLHQQVIDNQAENASGERNNVWLGELVVNDSSNHRGTVQPERLNLVTHVQDENTPVSPRVRVNQSMTASESLAVRGNNPPKASNETSQVEVTKRTEHPQSQSRSVSQNVQMIQPKEVLKPMDMREDNPPKAGNETLRAELVRQTTLLQFQSTSISHKMEMVQRVKVSKTTDTGKNTLSTFLNGETGSFNKVLQYMRETGERNVEPSMRAHADLPSEVGFVGTGVSARFQINDTVVSRNSKSVRLNSEVNEGPLFEARLVEDGTTKSSTEFQKFERSVISVRLESVSKNVGPHSLNKEVELVRAVLDEGFRVEHSETLETSDKLEKCNPYVSITEMREFVRNVQAILQVSLPIADFVNGVQTAESKESKVVPGVWLESSENLKNVDEVRNRDIGERIQNLTGSEIFLGSGRYFAELKSTLEATRNSGFLSQPTTDGSAENLKERPNLESDANFRNTEPLSSKNIVEIKEFKHTQVTRGVNPEFERSMNLKELMQIERETPKKLLSNDEQPEKQSQNRGQDLTKPNERFSSNAGVAFLNSADGMNPGSSNKLEFSELLQHSRNLEEIYQRIRDFTLSPRVEDKIEMKLQPDFLGNLEVQLRKEGSALYVTFVTESKNGKEMLEKGIYILRERLSGLDFDVRGLEIKVREEEQYNYQEGRRDHQGGQQERQFAGSSRKRWVIEDADEREQDI
ncbi:flagellar hook-length control protein FliK [Fervidobacterium thailandense]|uniref:flagellar hook-length control protein FliK n=1 Tax=Fervidobacterium thailandense TaxID=1008305 RepID=UPI001F4D4131|nr:flagellar hook-length control protein FliK [Fervidobacterium thailandense]